MLNGKQVILMEPKDYTVIKIEGEYAYLREDGETEDKAIFIAMALLPPALTWVPGCIMRCCPIRL